MRLHRTPPCRLVEIDQRDRSPMLSRRDDPFPVEACRDLLGLIRAIYRNAVKAKEPPLRLAKIAAIGLQLQEAIDLAVESKPAALAPEPWTPPLRGQSR
jgi:hypothetical protein